MADDVMNTAPSEDVVERDDRPAIDPETGWNRIMVEQIARSIQIAHDLNSKVWSTKIYFELPIVNMGNTTFVAGGKNGSARFLVDRDTLTPDQMETFEKFRTTDEFPSNPSFSIVDLPLRSTAVGLALFADAHTAAIKHTAKYWKINQRWKWHQEEARQQIERVAGITIPEPGYLPELRELHGSSNGATSVLEHLRGRRYWKFGGASFQGKWGDVVRASMIGITNWSKTEVDLDELPSEQTEFQNAIRKFGGIGPQAAELCWKMRHVVQLGDMVAVELRNSIVGWGSITGEYRYAEVPNLPVHQRPVEWHGMLNRSLREVPQELQKRLKKEAPVELTFLDFVAAIGATSSTNPEEIDPSAWAGGSSVQPLPYIRAHFAAPGLQYTDAQLATFYTALQTKGFVVLSGTSGTGKSKIAQGFVDMMPRPTAMPDDVEASGVLRLKRMPTFPKHHRVTLPAKQIGEFTFPEEKATWPVRARMNDKQSEATLWVQWLGGQRMVQLFIRGELVDAIAAIPKNGRFYGSPEIDENTGRIVAIDFFRQPPTRDGDGFPMKPGSKSPFPLGAAGLARQHEPAGVFQPADADVRVDRLPPLHPPGRRKLPGEGRARLVRDPRRDEPGPCRVLLRRSPERDRVGQATER